MANKLKNSFISQSVGISNSLVPLYRLSFGDEYLVFGFGFSDIINS